MCRGLPSLAFVKDPFDLTNGSPRETGASARQRAMAIMRASHYLRLFTIGLRAFTGTEPVATAADFLVSGSASLAQLIGLCTGPHEQRLLWSFNTHQVMSDHQWSSVVIRGNFRCSRASIHTSRPQPMTHPTYIYPSISYPFPSLHLAPRFPSLHLPTLP